MSVDALREATRADHARTERQSPMAALGDPALTVPRYAGLLYGLERLYRTVDARLAEAALRWAPQLDLPARAALARRDLAVLGIQVPRRPVVTRGEPDPDDADLPELDGRAAFIGALYVVEGSALGGRLIAARLRRDGRIPAAAMNLLTLGSSVSPAWRWRIVCGICEVAFADGVAVDEAIEGARAAFAWFDAPLRRRVPETGELPAARGDT